MRELLEIKLFVVGLGLNVESKRVNISAGDCFADMKEIVNKSYVDKKVLGKEYDYLDCTSSLLRSLTCLLVYSCIYSIAH